MSETHRSRASSRKASGPSALRRQAPAVVCAILGATAVVFGGLLVYSGAMRTSPHIASGVSVSGVDVSGMTREEAAAAISRELQPLLDERVELVYGDE